MEAKVKKSKKDTDLWRCEECGSTRISCRVWLDGNTYELLSDADDREDMWCDDCDEHTDHIRESKLMRDYVEPWWEGCASEDRGTITGLNRKDFNPEDDDRAFKNACEAWWMRKTNDEKIRLWNKSKPF